MKLNSAERCFVVEDTDKFRLGLPQYVAREWPIEDAPELFKLIECCLVTPPAEVMANEGGVKVADPLLSYEREVLLNMAGLIIPNLGSVLVEETEDYLETCAFHGGVPEDI